MIHKPFTKEDALSAIANTAINASEKTVNAVQFNYTPLPTGTTLLVVITESIEKYADWLFALRINIHRSTVDQLEEFNGVLKRLIFGEEVDIEKLNLSYWNSGLTGIEVEDHRNDPPHVYEDDDED